jgi:hypothetical protein
VVLDLAILTKKSSAVRIQRTSAGLVERRTIRDAIKPLSFVTHFQFAVSYRLATYELLLLDRWSPRAMSGEEITEEELIRLFEAARWAPFPFNVRSGVHCMFVVAPSIGRSFSSYLWTVPQAGC